MKLRATRTILNDFGTVRRGAEFSLSDVDARALIARGYAVAVEEAAASEPKPKAASAKKPKS